MNGLGHGLAHAVAVFALLALSPADWRCQAADSLSPGARIRVFEIAPPGRVPYRIGASLSFGLRFRGAPVPNTV